MTLLQLSAEEMLATTRSVRKRLDFSRPVEPEVIRECLELAVQAPTGANSQGWHFVVVTDQEQLFIEKVTGYTVKRRHQSTHFMKAVPFLVDSGKL